LINTNISRTILSLNQRVPLNERETLKIKKYGFKEGNVILTK